LSSKVQRSQKTGVDQKEAGSQLENAHPCDAEVDPFLDHTAGSEKKDIGRVSRNIRICPKSTNHNMDPEIPDKICLPMLLHSLSVSQLGTGLVPEELEALGAELDNCKEFQDSEHLDSANEA
jgi:hypothetical protein